MFFTRKYSLYSHVHPIATFTETNTLISNTEIQKMYLLMLSVLFPLRARAFSLAHALALAVHDAVSLTSCGCCLLPETESAIRENIYINLFTVAICL